MLLAPVTPKEVLKVVQLMKVKKQQSCRIYQHGSSNNAQTNIREPLSKLINASFFEGAFPNLSKNL